MHGGQHPTEPAPVDDPSGSAKQLTFTLVSKFPPSPSGIGLYADIFERALERLGVVRRRAAPARPRDSQRLTAAAQGLLAGWRHGRAGVDVVQVELGGRALYEFFFAQGLLCHRRRPMLVLTCHDAPSLVGASMLVTELDHRGLRRLGLALSRTVGARLEARLVHGADSVLTLTQAGADALSGRYGRPVDTLPHVVVPFPRVAKQPVVFVPGYVSDADGIVAIARALKGATLEGKPWRLVVGLCTEEVQVAVTAAVPPVLLKRVSFTGHLTERALLDLYQQSAVVVRLGAQGFAGNQLAASGPLCWAAAAGCSVLTNDARPVAVEFERLGLLRTVVDPAAALRELMDAPELIAAPGDIAARAERLMGIRAVAERYALVVPLELVKSGQRCHLASGSPAPAD